MAEAHNGQPAPAAGVISFDLDGTLISGPFGRVLTDLHDDLVKDGRSPVKPEIQQRHRQLLASDPLAAYNWDAIVAEVLARNNDPQPFDLVERLGVHVRDGRTKLLHERTFENLAALRSAGWRVVVLTNGLRRYQEPILAGAGLLDAIDQLLTADDVGQPKPNAAPFLAARGDAGRYVHVGDRLDHDIAGGNAVRAETILLDRDLPVHGERAGLSAEDSTALLGYLDELADRQEILPISPEQIQPDFLATSLTEIIDWLA